MHGPRPVVARNQDGGRYRSEPQGDAMTRPGRNYNQNWGPDSGADTPDSSRLDEASVHQIMGKDLPGMVEKLGPVRHGSWMPVHNFEGIDRYSGYGNET